MGLPWVRLDTNIAGHDKILELLADDAIPIGGRYQAAFSYVCSIAYAGGQETDGLIRFAALPAIHGAKKTAQLLVKHYLWAPDPLGWQIVNYGKRQQLSAASKQIKNAQRAGALKANCARWHGAECGCWEAAAS
jgi:hypothetical protein